MQQPTQSTLLALVERVAPQPMVLVPCSSFNQSSCSARQTFAVGLAEVVSLPAWNRALLVRVPDRANADEVAGLKAHLRDLVSHAPADGGPPLTLVFMLHGRCPAQLDSFLLRCMGSGSARCVFCVQANNWVSRRVWSMCYVQRLAQAPAPTPEASLAAAKLLAQGRPVQQCLRLLVQSGCPVRELARSLAVCEGVTGLLAEMEHTCCLASRDLPVLEVPDGLKTLPA